MHLWGQVLRTDTHIAWTMILCKWTKFNLDVYMSLLCVKTARSINKATRHHRPKHDRDFMYITFLSWSVATAAPTGANRRRYTANGVLNSQQHPPSGMKWPQTSVSMCLSGGRNAKQLYCGSLLSNVKVNIISSWLLFCH